MGRADGCFNGFEPCRRPASAPMGAAGPACCPVWRQQLDPCLPLSAAARIMGPLRTTQAGTLPRRVVAERVRPVARRERKTKGALADCSYPATSISAVHLRSNGRERLQGWTVFYLPSTPDGKLSTVPPRLRPAGAIDGSHAALTSTASYLGREAVRDVFPSAGEKAAPPFCFVVDRGRRRGTTVRRARPPAARAPTSSCTSVRWWSYSL